MLLDINLSRLAGTNYLLFLGFHTKVQIIQDMYHGETGIDIITILRNLEMSTADSNVI